jgi:hypothetical protein
LTQPIQLKNKIVACSMTNMTNMTADTSDGSLTFDDAEKHEDAFRWDAVGEIFPNIPTPLARLADLEQNAVGKIVGKLGGKSVGKCEQARYHAICDLAYFIGKYSV